MMLLARTKEIESDLALSFSASFMQTKPVISHMETYLTSFSLIYKLQ